MSPYGAVQVATPRHTFDSTLGSMLMLIISMSMLFRIFIAHDFASILACGRLVLRRSAAAALAPPAAAEAAKVGSKRSAHLRRGLDDQRHRQHV